MSKTSSLLTHGSASLLAAPGPATTLTTIAEDTTTKTATNEQVFTSNVTFSFSANESPINDRIASLFALLKKHDPTFSIHPTDTAKHLNPIVIAASIPKDPEIFANYFTGFTETWKTIKFHATTVSALRINQLKHTQGTFAYLKKFGIYLKYNQINSIKVRSIGWIYNKHPEATSRFEVKKTMSSLLGGFEEFQLNSRDVKTGRDATMQLRTRAWVVEMDQDEAESRMTNLLEKCHLGAAIEFVPFNDSWDSTGAIETFFIKQNQLLRDSKVIFIDGLQGLDQFVTDGNGIGSTVRDAFMDQKQQETGERIFSSISQVNSKRVCFLTRAAFYDAAIQAIDEFLGTFIPALTAAEREALTFMDKDPYRVGKRVVPASISTYAEHLKDFHMEIDEETRKALALPPNRHGKRTYKEATQGNTIDLTASTASTSSETASQGPSDFELKLAAVTDSIHALQTKISTNQTTLSAQETAAAIRMTTLEDSVLSTNSNLATLTKQQGEIQDTVKATHERLTKLEDLLQQLLEKKTSPAASPLRKIAKTVRQDKTASTEPPDRIAADMELS